MKKRRDELNEGIDIITLDLQEEKEKKTKTRGRQTVRRKEEHRKEGKKKKNINREFTRVTYFFVMLFLVMLGYMVYFNVVRSKDIINSPYNKRLDSMADRVVRGKILDSEGNVLAETEVSEDGTEQRVYPYGELYAHAVGYDVHGKSGLESVENFELLSSNAFIVERILKQMNDEKNIGDNVVTTFDTSLQKAAYDALGSYNGAAVAVEVSTGKILAMVSKPCFDPNNVDGDWEDLIESEDSELLNRATQGMYAPGSVFKIVTTLAYMRQENDYEEYTYDCQGSITHGETTIHCAKNRAHGLEDLQSSFANSCNASFCNIGLQLELTEFQDTAEDLLFNKEIPSKLPYSKSKMLLDQESTDAEIMMTAMGQGRTLVSPYHMTLITSAIANGGTLMTPYLVDHVENHTGSVVDKNIPKKYGDLMTSEEASQLKEYMQSVVTSGTGSALNNRNYTVAGKTGTAEYSSDKEKAHSWFTGFSNVDDPDIAISVVVESADNSGMTAVSVAGKIWDAYYR